MKTRTKAWFLGLLLLLMFYGLLVLRSQQPQPPVRIEWSPQEKAWVTERMKNHHGIDGCIRENGKYYFYRNGKKCKL